MKKFKKKIIKIKFSRFFSIKNQNIYEIKNCIFIALYIVTFLEIHKKQKSDKMEEDPLRTLFKFLRDPNNKQSTLDFINKQAFKISKKPSEYSKYFEKIKKYFFNGDSYTSIRANILVGDGGISKGKMKEIDTNKIFEIFAEIPREKTKERKIFIRGFAEFTSGLIPREYWVIFSTNIFSSLKITKESIKSELEEISKTVEENRIPYFISFPEKKLSNFVFSDITYPFPHNFCFFVVISTLVSDENILEKILNTTFLYSFSVIKKEQYIQCLKALSKEVFEYFDLYLNEIEPYFLHPSELRKHLKYVMVEKYDSVFHKKVIQYITDNSDEATVTNAERLANLSRFITKQKNTFWQDFYLYDENAGSRYNNYIKAARFSRMQSDDELSGLNEASFAVFGKDYDLSTRVDEPCVTKAIISNLHREASFMNKQCITTLKKELENTNYKSPNYRFLYKYLISKRLVERTIILDGFEGVEIDPDALKNEHILAQFKFLQTKKISTILSELGSEEAIFSKEGAIIAYYLSKLISILSNATPEENTMNISDVIMTQTPPFNQFSGELCCIDMVLIKLEKAVSSLSKASTLIIPQSQMNENDADFLFSFKKEGGKFKITPIINPFVTFQDDDD